MSEQDDRRFSVLSIGLLSDLQYLDDELYDIVREAGKK